jgi:hypothetical protein
MEVTLTLRELASILDPPMTARQFAALAVIAGIHPSGHRRNGQPGHPPRLYDSAAMMRAHAEEARRTVKQFADTDWLASALLGRDLIRADAEAGELWWAGEARAEELQSSLYGAVRVGPVKCPAHRVIWIAAEGEIPPGIQINHINRRRWDNRRANLELVTFGNNIRHAYGTPYLNYHDAVSQYAVLPPPLTEMPAPAESLIRAGGAFRHPGH